VHESYGLLTTFSDLGIAEILLRALERAGYETPTTIQAQAIPPLMQGRDLLGIAQTGTGKTAAFALPILDRMAGLRQPPAPYTARALILAPTRELAAQIADSFRAYGAFLRPAVGVIVGGVSHRPQIEMLERGLDVLVATPGRLLDHIASGKFRPASTGVLVLDEADHMLDLGFIAPIRKIVSGLPKTRQTLLFSATMPQTIATLAKDLLKDPVEVAVTPVATTAERIAQQVLLIDNNDRRIILTEVLSDPNISRAIVFTRTKRGADRVAQHLEGAGVGADVIHGNKSQSQRLRALDNFRKGRTRILVATDIAARGIDVDDVTHVVNYELPDTPEAYVHRIGRTARAGASGRAISLCDHGERPLLRAIEKITRQTLPLTDRRRADSRRAETHKDEGRVGARDNHGKAAQKPRRDAVRAPVTPPSSSGRDEQRRGQQPERTSPSGPRRRQARAGTRSPV
jgi:ATP-dependent RNA helicase RhlE